MRILFNFIPIKKGGGQQVAISFINVIKDLPFFKSSLFLTTKDTEVQKILSGLQTPNLITVGNSYFKRFIFEKFELEKIVKAHNMDIVFTMFGPDLPKLKIPSVVGSAYSNIFFPEIDFWRGAPIHKKVLLKLIDNFRLKRTLQADGIIFENNSMKKRSRSLYGYPENRSIFIKPSISKISTTDFASSQFIETCKTFPSHFKVLILSTWQKNKNMGQVPFILKELAKKAITDVSFIMTISEDHPLSADLIYKSKEFGVLNNIQMIGSVSSIDIPYLYNQIDAVLLISSLESFSNNIIESWTYGKPLIISNLEWAIEICGQSAVYANPFDPEDVAHKIIKLKDNTAYYNSIVQKGYKEIETYPSPEDKVLKQLDFVKYILERTD